MDRFSTNRFRPAFRVVLMAAGLLATVPELSARRLRAPSKLPIAPQAEAPDLTTVRKHLAGGEYNLAEAELRRAILLAPTTADPHFLLGFALFKERRPKDSLAAYTQGATFRRPTADEFVIIASDYVLLDDYADAQRWLTVATREAPQNVSAWYLLGRTEFHLDHSEQARDAFLTCLRLDPAHLRAQYNLGLTYTRLQQPEMAAHAYEKAIELTSGSPHPDPQPYLDLGMLLLSQNRLEKALPLLQKAVQLAPGNPTAHEQLALCLEKSGRDAEAATEMLACVHLAPDVAAPSFLLGRIYRRLGRLAEAKEQFDHAAQLAGTQSSKEVPNPAPEQ